MTRTSGSCVRAALVLGAGFPQRAAAEPPGPPPGLPPRVDHLPQQPGHEHTVLATLLAVVVQRNQRLAQAAQDHRVKPDLFALGGDYTVMLVPQGNAETDEEVGEE